MATRKILWRKTELKELIPRNFNGLTGMFTSLRSPNFRLYFFGQCFSLCGTWIQAVAMGLLVFELSRSVVMLTVVTFVNQIPSLFITPFTGVLSDRMNRWKIITITQLLFSLAAATLAVLALTGMIEVWQIVVVSAFTGIVAAIEAPARQSFYSNLVPPEDLANAIALNSLTINGSRFIGPVLGGIIVTVMDYGYCFALNAASYIVVIVALMMMKMPPFVRRVTEARVVADMREGVSYIGGHLPIRTMIFFVAALSFIGLPFLSVMPAFVTGTLNGSKFMFGLFNSCLGVGTMSAALYLASRKKVKGLGKVATITSFMLGFSLLVLSFTKSLVAACVIAVPLGFAFIGSVATANTLLQTMVDPSKRGRVMSFFTMAFAGMMPLGVLLYGFLSKVMALEHILLCGGIGCLLTCVAYEYYRPVVRAAAQERYVSKVKKGVVGEFAKAIDNPF